MDEWMKVSIRRKCGNFQFSRRGLHLYVLMCVFLSSSILFVISLQLYNRLYLGGFLQDDSNPSSSIESLAQQRLESDELSLSGSKYIKNPKQLGPHISSGDGRVRKSNHWHASAAHNSAHSEPVLSPSILAWDYHRNTSAPRKIFNCRRLIAADKQEQAKYKAWINSRPDLLFSTVKEDIVPQMTSDCAAFKAIRGYPSTVGTDEERDFPIAHVILMHKDFEHMERLVRALYRPQNAFCIHLDSKASESLKIAVAAYARCFDNVYLAPKPQSIIYAHVSRLVADIDCMEELLRRDSSWKYLVNYAATELPIRTNLETVQILSSLQGLNDIHESYNRRIVARFDHAYKVVNGRLKATKAVHPPAPHNITIVKGQAYNSFSRAFLEWLFNDQRPRDLLVWSTKTYSPDEHYWASLNDLYHNKHLNAPGGYRGEPDKKGYLTKFILWTYDYAKFPCHGRAVHNICNFNALDLPTIVTQRHLSANKYDLTLDPVAHACMEELLENRTLTPDPKFNRRKYEMLHFVQFSFNKTKGKA